jgi:imidazolonepropionase-like amidohydrolase
MRNLFVLLISGAMAMAQTAVLSHATVIDGTGSPAIKDASIVISNGRIVEIGPAPRVKAPAGAQVVDLAGKTIIPGIINAHAHINAGAAAKIRKYAQHGVTTVIGMGGDGDDVLRLRDEQRRTGVLNGARILTVQERFEFVKDSPAPEIARMKVDELAKKNVDAVKVVVDNRRNTVVKLPAEITAAIIDQAHKRGLRVMGHIHDYEDAKRLVEQGVDMLAHEVRDREIDDAFVRLMKTRKVGITSTLTRELSTFTYADSPDWLNDPFFLKGAAPDLVQKARGEWKVQQAKAPDLALNRADFEFAAKNLKKLAAGGVRIGLGTDTGNPGPRFEGFFEHLEMELMAKHGGMTPMQVIQAFTKNNSESLGIDQDYGTLAKGKVADLVVLDRNPLEDIRNTRTIHAVYLGGKRFE